MIAYIVAAEIDIIKRCIFVLKKNGMVKFLSPTAFAGAKMDEFFLLHFSIIHTLGNSKNRVRVAYDE